MLQDRIRRRILSQVGARIARPAIHIGHLGQIVADMDSYAPSMGKVKKP
jgi:hypothetical protein